MMLKLMRIVASAWPEFTVRVVLLIVEVTPSTTDGLCMGVGGRGGGGAPTILKVRSANRGL